MIGNSVVTGAFGTESMASMDTGTGERAGSGVRVELKDALAGHYILVDVDAITMGMVEDMQTGQASAMLDHLSRIILGGDLIHGDQAERRVALRELPMRQLNAIVAGATSTLQVPNAS